jgi:heptosyltransferase-2
VHEVKKILVVQTAFLGDVILTLPMIQTLKRAIPTAEIDVVVIPRSAELLHNHPAIDEIVEFDKRGRDKGISGVIRKSRDLKRRNYDITFVPHRSLRSAALVTFAGIPRRIGFERSAGRLLLTNVVRYDKNQHEVKRNLSLLQPIGIKADKEEYPCLYPSQEDVSIVDRFLSDNSMKDAGPLIAVAPGTIWNTKRWLPERFIELVRNLCASDFQVILIGGKADTSLCDRIQQSVSSSHVVSSSGKLSLLQSAEVIRRCRALVCNDSAPMHLAVAVQTPVVALFGATIPEFGFAPYGKNDVVVETKGLPCRPCSIHGGDKCPITTFDCMVRISSDQVYDKVREVIEHSHAVR